MKSKIFRACFWFLACIYLFIGKFRKPEKRLLITRLDSIGDYILFRNFIEKIANKYKDYEIIMIGNYSWKVLAEGLDFKFVNNFIWVQSNSRNLYARPLQILKLLYWIFKKKFDVAIHPTRSRTIDGDIFTFASGAKVRIGMNEKQDDKIKWYYNINSHLYTNLIETSASFPFEFDQNKYFTECITQQKIDLSLPRINTQFLREIKEDYILVFPGGSDIKRKWPVNNVMKIVNRLLQATNVKIVLAGGESENIDAARIIQNVDGDRERIINKVAQSSLLQLVGLIQHAQFVLTNETSAVHIAVSVQTPSVCILGGGHFDRFMPYPNDTDKQFLPVAVYHKMSCYNCNWDCIYRLDKTQTYPCIEKIEEQEVWEQVSKQLRLVQDKNSF
jgi:ADP-heptose:LPS heptosyltransferase